MVSPELSFASRRSPVMGRRGIVAASQPLAVAAGLEILAQGGNAADAAVATAAALNVTEPTSTGIGGDCFALFYDAGTRQVSALNGSGRAPAALTLERLRREGFVDELPPYHSYTITVPGACAGWHDLVARHGRLPLSAVLAPAIRLADEGFPVAPLTAHAWERGAQRQLSQALNGAELTIDGRGPRPGEIFRNPGLARTLPPRGRGRESRPSTRARSLRPSPPSSRQTGGCLRRGRSGRSPQHLGAAHQRRVPRRAHLGMPAQRAGADCSDRPQPAGRL